MASLRKMRGKWYARVRKWDGIREKEILIPLRTESKVQALERLSRVKIYEKDIKSGKVKIPEYGKAGESDKYDPRKVLKGM